MFKMHKCIIWKFCQYRYGVGGYPTLKFFPKNNKAGEDYEGGRDLDDLVSFINEKCGTSRDGQGRLTSKVSITIYFTEKKTRIIYLIS